MTRTLILAATAALTLAGPALASDQLARSLGVDPDDYTRAELVALQDAVSDDDRARVARIMRSAEAPETTRDTGYETVDRGLTAAERVAIRHFEQNNEQQRAEFVRSGGLR